ncbi:rft1 family protein [Stylonychia lemnae]|uniref:Protein RFT1 homolog n=1 Tax=Stylonychia lemnae TaxID=5949 RepID=A0A078AI42_STYLE|nr:rft1 family protein [Stylonychia lemnae]|eukprot:CDW81920.1 rft1 family protein [Stylonychia lemnae]
MDMTFRVKSESLDVQAEFGLVSNLISIVCRFVFQPIEEMSFNLFSKYNTKKINADEKKDQQSNGQFKSPLFILAKITQFLGIIGFGMIIFGVFFSKLFIRIVYTEKWATDSAQQIMQAYCIYTFFMALNGVTEAYIYAKAHSEMMRKLQTGLVITSLLIGIQGLIYGNCINMGMRIVMSLYYSIDIELKETQQSSKMQILKRFFKDVVTVDFKTIIEMVKNRRN